MVFVTIKEGFQQDFALGIGRISHSFFTAYKLKIDEIVELISGEKRVPIRLRPLEELPEEFIEKNTSNDVLYINGYLRSNLKVAIGQQIDLDKTNYQIAKEITVAVIHEDDRQRIYTDYFINRPLIPGQLLELTNIFNRDLIVGVVKTEPVGITVVNKKTTVFIADETPEELQNIFSVQDSTMYDDIGGFNSIKHRLRSLVEIPLRNPEIFENLNITPPLGVLITGSKGTGKTLISKAVSTESGAPRFYIMATEIVKGWWESEGEMDKYFTQIKNYAPAVVIIDQIDVLAPAPSSTITDLERRLTERLISNLSDIKNSKYKIVIIGTCENAELVHPALRTYGRFEVEINIPLPDKLDRIEILKVLTRGIPLKAGTNLSNIAERTNGFTPADLELLVKEAGMKALEKYDVFEKDIEISSDKELGQIDVKKLYLSQEEFISSLIKIKPTATKEFTPQIPQISWDDIGGLSKVKQAIQETIAWPIHFPEVFTDMGIKPPKGILLYGPPGTGKTLVAKAIANQIRSNFLVVKGPELLSKWFSESPRMIRDLFKKARQLAPCIVFFDELDALAPLRSSGTGGGSGQERDRVINQLLATMDGIDNIKGVFVIGATNRPKAIDPALLRPGRIDRLIYVNVPNNEERLQILKVHAQQIPLAKDVNLPQLAGLLENFTGADIQNFVREAVFSSLRKDFSTTSVTMDDFESALKVCHPSVSKAVISSYEQLEKEFVKKKMSEYIIHGFQEFM